LNPIELRWAILKNIVARLAPKTVEELKHVLFQLCESVNAETIRRRCSSFEARLRFCLDLKNSLGKDHHYIIVSLFQFPVGLLKMAASFSVSFRWKNAPARFNSGQQSLAQSLREVIQMLERMMEIRSQVNKNGLIPDIWSTVREVLTHQVKTELKKLIVG
jgi:hypothetical protein